MTRGALGRRQCTNT